MAKTKTKVFYKCQACEAMVPSYLGRCPECNAWGSLQEVREGGAPSPHATRLAWQEEGFQSNLPTPDPFLLADISQEEHVRLSSGFEEMDRVLGGGVLPGALILLGGDPGIGKSTLLLQVAGRVGAALRNNIPSPTQRVRILYVAGEESPLQIKNRAERLGIPCDCLHMVQECNVLSLGNAILTLEPDLVIVDSVQSLYHPDQQSPPGSVGQLRECAQYLMGVVKSRHTALFLIGHVTKDGTVAGPKVLEHLVDTVLYLEGEKYGALRLLRTVKNRFGATHELGVFRMEAGGLVEVLNPSELFLSGVGAQPLPGSVVCATLEGSRPILVEVQALVGQSDYVNPRRVGNGVEINRLHQVLAILERRLGLDFSRKDIYVNVVGGLEVDDPGADLAMALAIVTSLRNVAIAAGTVVAGEMGLTGEIRAISKITERITEARKIGFQQFVGPAFETSETTANNGQPFLPLTVCPVKTVMEAISHSLPAPIYPSHNPPY